MTYRLVEREPDHGEVRIRTEASEVAGKGVFVRTRTEYWRPGQFTTSTDTFKSSETTVLFAPGLTFEDVKNAK